MGGGWGSISWHYPFYCLLPSTVTRLARREGGWRWVVYLDFDASLENLDVQLALSYTSSKDSDNGAFGHHHFVVRSFQFHFPNHEYIPNVLM